MQSPAVISPPDRPLRTGVWLVFNQDLQGRLFSIGARLQWMTLNCNILQCGLTDGSRLTLPTV
jgi:hypothetical protein